jgi:hypothetical protein
MDIIRITPHVEHDGIVFATLAELTAALSRLGASRDESPTAVQALVAELVDTVVNGTEVAAPLVQALYNKETFGTYGNPPGLIRTELPGQVRRVFIHNELRNYPPFQGLTIRAWGESGVYVLSVFERDAHRDPRTTEGQLAMEVGAERAIRSAGVTCATRATRNGASFEYDLELIMLGLCDVGLTRLTGEGAAMELCARAERSCRGSGPSSAPSLYFDNDGYTVQLGFSGCNPVKGDMWQVDGDVIRGPRTPRWDGEFEDPTFWLSITPRDGLWATAAQRDAVSAFAQRLADAYTPRAPRRLSGRRLRRRG